MNPTVTIIGKTRCRLGESPLWEPDSACLFWVDSVAPSIWRYDPATGEQSEMSAPNKIGSIVRGRAGQLIAALADGIYRVDLATGQFEPIVCPPELTAHERLNDGKTDRSGRFITGSITHGSSTHIGKLFQFSERGVYKVVPTEPIGISNAICFSPVGDIMYFADSLRRVVWAYAYDTATGEVGARQDLIDTTSLGSAPDGATVDAEGYLWIALVQAQKIARVAPDGRVDQVFDCPAPFPSCPAFGGANLDILYITSISNSGGALVSEADQAGRLVQFQGLGVRGLAETRCSI